MVQADKSHVHHQLLRLGWNQKQAAYFLYFITLLLGGIAIFFSLQHSVATLILGACFIVSLSLVTWYFWRQRERPPPDVAPK
jgi:UDP-GlcNAc:undecaprenyl-phosphate GlcNAc-1-phosphate transferase